MFDLTDILINQHESIYHQRCHDIEEQLKEYNVKANVSRHTFDNTEYYVLEVDLNGNTACHTISKALGIKLDDVHFIHINLNDDYKILWISEDLLHSCYLDNNGRLDFETIEDKAIRLIHDDNTICTNIWNNPEDIIIRLQKKKGELL